MLDKALYTACSNKYFPGVINQLGSLKVNYPGHPKVFVYDLGISYIFKKELEQIENVEVVPMPHFVSYWRSCYTWKTFIFAHPKARLNFYMDSGCEALGPLDEIFDFIERDDYFCVRPDQVLHEALPLEYRHLFPVDEKYYNMYIVAGGTFGFKNPSRVTPALEDVYQSAVAGLSLGFSPKDLWRNKGHNKSVFVRGCSLFRHDTSLLSVVLRKYLGDYVDHGSERYGGRSPFKSLPDQLIFNSRMLYLSTPFLRREVLHKKKNFAAAINRVYIRSFLFVRKCYLFVKGSLGLL